MSAAPQIEATQRDVRRAASMRNRHVTQPIGSCGKKVISIARSHIAQGGSSLLAFAWNSSQIRPLFTMLPIIAWIDEEKFANKSLTIIQLVARAHFCLRL